jgi:hypothetical protein
MANPTTNYGFVLPTPTDLVTDLPADFDVALQGVDTRLKALQPGTTLGDLAYSSATANTNTRLGIGSTGNVLTVAGGVPTWAAPAGGGKVLQVVSTTTTTQTSIATASYADTGLSLSITPTLATSKVLVLTYQGFATSRQVGQCGFGVQLLRGATVITTPATDLFFSGPSGATSTYLNVTSSISYLDSPATTSATTYKTQAKPETTAQSSTLYAQWNNTTATMILMEIGA